MKLHIESNSSTNNSRNWNWSHRCIGCTKTPCKDKFMNWVNNKIALNVYIEVCTNWRLDVESLY